MLGENFTFTTTFSNTVDTGYGPFIDVILPANGADGNGNTSTPLDGISFNSSLGATYLGNTLTTTLLTFPNSGATNTCVNHPYAVAPVTGTALQVCGKPGDQLVVIQLPFGSFTPGQPGATVTVNATLSNRADVGTPLTLRARGGFQYGATPTSDWCCAPFDATILSQPSTDGTTWTPSASTTPTLITLSKSNNAPETETATGPNYPRRYTLNLDIASGQVITNVVVSDAFPINLQFSSVISTSPAGGTCSTTPNPLTTPGGTLSCSFSTITGTTSVDATIVVEFYIPLTDSLRNAN